MVTGPPGTPHLDLRWGEPVPLSCGAPGTAGLDLALSSCQEVAGSPILSAASGEFAGQPPLQGPPRRGALLSMGPEGAGHQRQGAHRGGQWPAAKV